MTSDRWAGTLKTTELLAKIETDLGLCFDHKIVSAWVNRPENPLIPAYSGKNGQSRRFVWVDFLAWYDQYGDVPNTHGREPTDPDDLDWHGARTVSARAQAKRDILLTARLEGKYGDIKTMEQTGENAARQAVLALLAIPSRIAPRLAALTDELAIDRLLDAEIRQVCADLEASALRSIDLDDEPQPAEAA